MGAALPDCALPAWNWPASMAPPPLVLYGAGECWQAFCLLFLQGWAMPGSFWTRMHSAGTTGSRIRISPRSGVSQWPLDIHPTDGRRVALAAYNSLLCYAK